MPGTCVFELDRPSGIYFSGETITGRIHLQTTTDRTINGIYIRVHGAGEVRFKNEANSRNPFHGEETYLESRAKVFPCGLLPAGTHSYTIKIPIPLPCPTTCQTAFGNIRYELSLVVRKTPHNNDVFTRNIVIIQSLDLNMFPRCANKVRTECCKTFGVWPFNSATMHFTFATPYGGYVPKQGIFYALRIHNKSSKVREICYRIMIKQMFMFTAQRPHKRSKRCERILKQKLLKVQCLPKKTFQVDDVLMIPQAPPTLQNSCIISVGYFLQIDIALGSGKFETRLAMPLLLGTVPLSVAQIDPAPKYVMSYDYWDLEPLLQEIHEAPRNTHNNNDNWGGFGSPDQGNSYGASSDFSWGDSGGGGNSGGNCDSGGGGDSGGGCDSGDGGDSGGGCDSGGGGDSGGGCDSGGGGDSGCTSND